MQYHDLIDALQVTVGEGKKMPLDGECILHHPSCPTPIGKVVRVGGGTQPHLEVELEAEAMLDSLEEVSGVGPKLAERIRTHIQEQLDE